MYIDYDYFSSACDDYLSLELWAIINQLFPKLGPPYIHDKAFPLIVILISDKGRRIKTEYK